MVAAGPEHIPSLVEGMSPLVKRELQKRYPGVFIEDVLAIAISRADEAYAGFVGDDLVCVIGVSSENVLSTVGHPWLIPHTNVNKHKWVFLKGSKPWIQHLLSKYESLENSVPASHKRAVRWLKWLGFTIEPAINKNGIMVHPYRIQRA